MTEPLYEATRKLMRDCPRHVTLSQIAKDTGLKPAWLSAFSRDKIPDPGVKKVQQLYDYLIVNRPVNRLVFLVGELKQKLPTFKDLRAHVPFVYFVFAGEELLYIGKTCSLRSRLLGHQKWPAFITEKDDRIVAVAFEDTKDQEAYEREQIKLLNPKLNFVHTSNPPRAKLAI